MDGQKQEQLMFLAVEEPAKGYVIHSKCFINARRMRTRVIVLTVCVCVCKSLLTSYLVYTTK